MRSLEWILAGACVAALAARPARACGADGLWLDVTFDAAIIGGVDSADLRYDPARVRFGDPCPTCAVAEMRADWAGYLGSEVPADAWMKVLLEAPLEDIDKLIFALKGDAKALAAKKGDPIATLTGAAKDRAIAALFFVGFARRVEPFADTGGAGWAEDGERKAPPTVTPDELIKKGEAAYARAKDPFLKQRYAFQLLRLRFYNSDRAGVLAWFDAEQKALAGPSTALAWRARYYAAGAAIRAGDRARGNLELARVHVGFPTLGPVTANDFSPSQESDWRASLALAKTPRDRAALWRLVGVRFDGVAAMREIHKLEPKSDLLALLAVREINKLEMHPTPDGLAQLAAVATKIAKTPGADRPWLLHLVAAHAAALDGDVGGTKAQLAAARKARPGDKGIEKQALTTLVLGLAHGVAKKPAIGGEELAALLEKTPVGDDVKMRAFVLVGGKHMPSWPEGSESDPKPEVLRARIAAVRQARTPFEKFLVSHSDEQGLVAQLVETHVLRGEFAEAQRVGAERRGPGPVIGCDPFALGVLEDYDCVPQANGLTQAALVKRLVELEAKAKGKGDDAAKAALDVGTALFRRHAVDVQRGTVVDTRPATAWAERAYALATGRELKARAAFLAARSERLHGTSRYNGGLALPAGWYGKLRALDDTAFHREVLAECGTYREWHGAKR